MKTSFDVEFLPERGSKNGKKEAPEITEIKSFLACKYQNMRFEYDNDRQARNRLKVIQQFRNGNGLQEVFECYRVEQCVYVIRTKKKGHPEKGKETAIC